MVETQARSVRRSCINTRFRGVPQTLILLLFAMPLRSQDKYAEPVSTESPQISTTFAPPAFQFLRQNENWSALRDAEPSQVHWLDAIKYMPLSDDGWLWASFGGHVRLRWENWDNFGFAAANDDDFLLARVMLHADVHAGENVRFFVEGKSTQSTDRDLPGGRRAALDVDSLDLQQAFVDVTIPLDDASLTIRPGRQMLLFGKQRLISPLPWSNNLRAWDGLSLMLNVGGWRVHGFWTQFVPVQKFAFNDADAQTEFFGVYAAGKAPGTDIGLDLYFIGLDREGPVTFNGTMGSEDRYTFGGRVFGPIGKTGLDYEMEGAYQSGEVGAGDIDAYMFAGELGYRLADFPTAPRLFIGFDYASGDESAGGDVQTFNQLFPLGHAYFGFIDTIGRQNIIDASAGLSLTPVERTTLRLAGHLFYLADNDDALYNAGGAPIRAGRTSADREVGAEIDLTIAHQFTRHLAGEIGYSHFFAGDVLRDSAARRDIDFVYIQLQFTF